MNLKYLLILFVIIIILFGVFDISFGSEKELNRTSVSICTDSPITLDRFTDDIRNNSYYNGYNETTLNWLESLDGEYMVFSSEDAYYILDEDDALSMPQESSSDVSIYNFCNCTVIDQKPLGKDLKDVVLIDDVEFINQHVNFYDGQ